VKLGQHRLRVFENRVLRRIFGPKRDEVTGGWRKLYNEGWNWWLCGTSGRDEKCIHNFCREVGREDLEDLGIDVIMV
jgi:hypothetical protein